MVIVDEHTRRVEKDGSVDNLHIPTLAHIVMAQEGYELAFCEIQRVVMVNGRER